MKKVNINKFAIVFIVVIFAILFISFSGRRHPPQAFCVDKMAGGVSLHNADLIVKNNNVNPFIIPTPILF